MGFIVSSTSSYQLKSMTLRTNEKFVRLYNDVVKAGHLNFRGSYVVDSSQESGYIHFLRTVSLASFGDWKRFQDCIRDVDQWMKRAEKKAHLSEILAGIMLQFEQILIPILRKIGIISFITFGKSTRTLVRDKTFLLEDLLEVFAECVSSELESAHKVVVLALVLLSFVYQYLIGCVDKEGAKTYSAGSLLFRLIFVAIVLFLGSYVGIKSRQTSFAASRRKRKSCELADRASQLGDESDVPRGVYRRAVRDSGGSVTHYKYEPRFKPRREKLESGTSLEFNYLPLGSYDTPREAEIVRHIASVLYGKEECRPVQFEDGFCLPFPSVTGPENCPPSGKEKAVWVTHKTKELYAELLKEEARRLQLLHPALETGSHHDHGGEARLGDPSPSAPVAPSTAIEMTCFTSPHGGNGVEEQATNSEFHRSGHEALRTREVFSTFLSDSGFVQFISSMAQWEENDSSAMTDLDRVECDYSETDHVFGCESTLVPPQSSALDIPTSAIVASLPPLGVGDEGLEIIEARLNSATAIPFQHLESLPEQVQLQVRVTCEEKHPEEFSGSNVELQQKLLESELRNSELQQKLCQSKVENEKWRSMCREWRSMFRQLAKLISASDKDGSLDDIR